MSAQIIKFEEFVHDFVARSHHKFVQFFAKLDTILQADLDVKPVQDASCMRGT